MIHIEERDEYSDDDLSVIAEQYEDFKKALMPGIRGGSRLFAERSGFSFDTLHFAVYDVLTTDPQTESMREAAKRLGIPEERIREMEDAIITLPKEIAGPLSSQMAPFVSAVFNMGYQRGLESGSQDQ